MNRRPRRGVVVLSGRRRERGALVLVAAVVAAVSALVVLAHDAMRSAEADGVRTAISDADPARRRLAVRLLERVAPGPAEDPLGDARDLLDAAAATIPSAVLSRVGEPRLVIDSNRFVITAVDGVEPGSPTFLTLRIHPDIDDHTEIVAGRAATEQTVDGDVPRIEVELSPDTAGVLGLAVGDVLSVAADITDPTTRRFGRGIPAPFEVEVVGLRAAVDPEDPYWFGDDRLHRAIVTDTGVGANYYAFASIPLGSLTTRPYIVRGTSPLAIEERRDLTDDPLDLDDAIELADGLRSLEALAVDQASPGRPAVVMGLRPVLDAEASQRAAARSAVTGATGGVVVLALLTVIGVMAEALARRRDWWEVARARGASRAQLVTSATIDLGGAAVLGGVVGLAAARVVARPTAEALVMIACLAVAGVVSSIALALAATGEVSARSRLAGGAVVVATTAALTVTVGRRGGSGDGEWMIALLCVAWPAAAVTVLRPVVQWLLRAIGRRGLLLGVGALVGVRRAADARSTLVTTVLAASTVLVGLGASVDASLSAVQSDDPLVRLVDGVHGAVAIGAVTLAVVALAVDAVLASRRRSRDLVLVALVAAAPREARRAAWAETGPVVLTGLAVGVLSTAVVVPVVAEAVDLSAFGSGLTLSWSGVVVAAAALVVAAVAVVIASTWRAHRLDPTTVMREQGSV